ncbi:MAG: S46 family peptidase [Bacteroidales bacterium]|nr:S46 family peptidase [Bacteroidales bacterium]
MKRFLITLACAFALLPATLRADEGMWMLPLLEKMNAEALKNLGSRLTPDQIYSINHSSIKDAVVQFGGGCTGEIISGSGLLVTNHHCGYGSIQSLSTPEHNYLEDGYWAMSREQELPVPGLTVRFLQSMTDVTDTLAAGADRAKLIKDAEAANPGCQVRLTSFYNENVYYIIVSKIYRDVRFVGAPPASSGKFGGDTDNWMWPRHTCDFSMFRVYAGPDNEPADYSPENVPMVPRQFLGVSLKGIQEGDFAMIMGYPGRTQRFQTAAQLEEMLATNNIRIAARTVWQDVIWKAMRADDKIGIQYASKYSGSSNGWKKWQGEEEAFKALDIIGREKQKESDLQAWIDADASRQEKWGTAISRISEAVDGVAAAEQAATLLSESLGRIEILSIAAAVDEAARAAREAAKAKPEVNEQEMLEETLKAVRDYYKDFNADVDRDAALAMIDFYKKNVKPADAISVNGKSLLAQDINKLVDNMYRKSIFTSAEKMMSKPITAKLLDNDPAVKLARAMRAGFEPMRAPIMASREKLRGASKDYTAALLEWKKGEASYPDANSTCRFTYGTVKGYEPKDGVHYKYYTTLKGVMEKENPDDYEFHVPAKLKEIYEARDYGQYADANGELITCFLTNLDITGGNSGSPVLDADGNLIGLAFDGNWEAMSSDVMFEPNLQRCICVDIRYVLLMMDKFGGAGYLLDEMNLVRPCCGKSEKCEKCEAE